MIMRLFTLVLGFLAVTAPLRAETTLRTTIGSDLRGLMPGISPDVATGAVLQQIYEGLVAWRADGSVAPMLADSIETAPDGLSVTFTLRQGVHFHNGAPLTAAEVVWTWRRFLDPKQSWSCRANFDGSRQINITAVEQRDAAHAVFHLAAPSFVLPSMMARSDCDSTGIAHPDSVDADGHWSRAIGTGPFRLAEWRQGEYVQLDRFADYASRAEPTDGLAGAKKAEVDHVRFLLIPDPSSARLALQSGNIDVWPDMDPSTATELRGTGGITIASSATAGLNMILMQASDPVLANPAIRKAISAALDTAAMRDSLYAGFGQPATSLMPTTSKEYGPVEAKGVVYDSAAAQKLLQQSHYAGQKVVITTNSQFGLMKDTAILAQAMLQAVGVNAEVETVEFATQLQRYYNGHYQLMIWNVTPYLDPLFSFDRFIGPANATPDKVWRSDAANALLGQLYAAADPAARQPVYDQLQRLFLQDAPLAVWLNRATVSGVRTTVHGYQPWAGLKPRFWNVSLSP